METPATTAPRGRPSFANPAPADAVRAAREFEGIFVAQLWEAMQRTIPGGGPFGDGGAFSGYGALITQQFTAWLAGGGNGLGLGLEEALLAPASRRLAAGPPADGARDASRAAAAVYASLPRVEAPAPAAARPPEIAVGTPPEEGAFAAVARKVRRFDEAIARVARDLRLDADLLRAVIHQESGGEPAARSRKGALGLMQLMPGTARDLGVARPLDPAENIRAGARYLNQMLERFGGRIAHALAAYNAGPARVERSGGVPPIAETRAYVPRVIALAARYRALGTERTDGSSAPAPRP